MLRVYPYKERRVILTPVPCLTRPVRICEYKDLLGLLKLTSCPLVQPQLEGGWRCTLSIASPAVRKTKQSTNYKQQTMVWWVLIGGLCGCCGCVCITSSALERNNCPNICFQIPNLKWQLGYEDTLQLIEHWSPLRYLPGALLNSREKLLLK